MKNILVAVNDRPVSEKVIHLASKIAKLFKARLYIVYVFEVPRVLSLDAEVPEEMAKGDAILERAAEIAEKNKLEVETDLLQARAAGPAIVDEAKDLGVDMIMLGVGVAAKTGDYLIGSTVNYVLKNAHCEVLVLRDNVPA